MLPRLPDFVDPWRLADSRRRLRASIPLARFPRLAEILVSNDGEAVCTLGFYRDGQRRTRVDVEVRALLQLQCQRCMEPVPVEVDARATLAVVEGNDEAGYLPDEVDPLMVDAGRLRLLDLVEDEILLALPQVPMHPAGACTVRIESVPPEEATPDKAGEAQAHPFASLSALKLRDV